MHTLIHDRYIASANNRFRDLATGEELAVASAPDSRRTCPALDTLLDALDHGREAEPRWLLIRATERSVDARIVEDIALAAQRRGYVPIAVGLYEQARQLLDADLRDRALVLIDGESSAPEPRACLMAAAAVSSRPHVLVTVRWAAAGTVVREARVAYGRVVAAESVPRPDVAALLARVSRAPAFVRAGRHASAERLLRETTGALERRSAFDAASRVACELGQLLLERGRAGAAEVSARDAARLADRAGDLRLACEAHLLCAWSCLEQGRVTDAESLARAVLLCAPTDGVRACGQATLVRCLLAQRRMRELGAMDVAVPMAEGISARWCAVLHDVAVVAHLQMGQLFEAGQRVQHACEGQVHEQDAVAAAIVNTAYLRVVVATGDGRLASAALEGALAAARIARSPLRGLRARVVWCAGMARADVKGEVSAERVRLRRLLAVAPRMLTLELEDGLSGAVRRGPSVTPLANLAATMLALCQDEDDGNAVRSVLACVQETLDAARLDVVSSDAGPATVLLSVGTGPATRIGARIIESGLAVGLDVGTEAGVPIRLGPRLVGALTVRWPAGRTVPADRQPVLECAAVVIAARIDGMHRRAQEEAAASTDIPELLGVAAATTELRRAVLRAARAPFSVLVEGESGVGKELVARAIHHQGARRERAFCDVNCAALPDDLFESELFGHAKGAFTGAVVDRAGLFESASGGTLFLDEVADLSLRSQAKLLRAVQQQEVRRVGESFTRPVDVRLVAAANRQMAEEVAAGRFRVDLLYRLDVIHIRIAPLRERPEDIPVIAEHLWRQAAARVGSTAILTPGTLAALVHYPWPGNVRELQNVIAALAVAAPPRGQVRAALLPAVISAAEGVRAERLATARDQFERRFIELALARCAGNRSRAARALGLSRQGLLKSMVRLGLRPSVDDSD